MANNRKTPITNNFFPEFLSLALCNDIKKGISINKNPKRNAVSQNTKYFVTSICTSNINSLHAPRLKIFSN